MLGLHTNQEKPDWEYITPQKYNKWQRLAARTQGSVTPGNLTTLLGLLLVATGLVMIMQSQYTTGLTLVVIGRLADIFDGIVADKTGTKSNLGALLDVVADKIAVLIALVVLVITVHVQIFVIATIVILNTVNAVCTLYAQRHSITLHTSRAGKYAMTLCWVLIVLAVFGVVYSSWLQNFIAYNVFLAYVVIGGWASYNYIQQLFARK